MTNDKLNQWLKTVANFGVIVGIFFLIFEIRLNTIAIQAQTRDSISEKEMQLYGWQATSPELAFVVDKVFRGEAENLTAVQDQRWFGYVEAVFREHENALYQFEQGLFNAEDFSGRVNNMRGLIEIAAIREHWLGRRDRYSPSLRTEIERILVEMGLQHKNDL